MHRNLRVVRWSSGLVCLVFSLVQSSRVQAEQVQFTVSTLSSSLTLSGSVAPVFGGSYNLTQQAPGSLQAVMNGLMLIDVDTTTDKIQFIGSTLANAVFPNNTLGGANLAPSNAPANWGFQAAFPSNLGLVGAVRGARGQFTSTAITMADVAAGSWNFNVGAMNFGLLAGQVDGQATNMGIPFGAVTPVSLTGSSSADNSASKATLLENAGIYTLTVPVDMTFTKTDSNTASTFTIRLQGTIVATATVPPTAAVPEPASWVLIGMAGLAFGGVCYRQRRGALALAPAAL